MSGRGRPGTSRYKNRVQTVIKFEVFQGLMNEIDPLDEDLCLKKSLLAILYYFGLRVAEICGDRERKWKKLTKKGRTLSNAGNLQKDWKDTDEGDLWYWEHRDSLPGIVEEDITLDGNILRVVSQPLKHGKREAPGGGEGVGELELDVRYPGVDMIVKQWENTEPGEKVWDMSTWKAWHFVSEISKEKLYPHAFRMSRATVMARNPEMSIADLMQWFGWARASTADSYIMATRSVTKARKALAQEIPPELMRREE